MASLVNTYNMITEGLQCECTFARCILSNLENHAYTAFLVVMYCSSNNLELHETLLSSPGKYLGYALLWDGLE
eukprot:1860245-Amphidinium_carterae.1